jgi:hypothetical protein
MNLTQFRTPESTQEYWAPDGIKARGNHLKQLKITNYMV